MFRKEFKHYNLFDQLNVKTGQMVNNSDKQLEFMKTHRGISPDKIQRFLIMYTDYVNNTYKK